MREGDAERRCIIILSAFLAMIFVLMTFFPQGNISGASSLIPEENQGSVYWLIVCLVVIAIPTLAFLIIKCKKKDDCLDNPQ